MFKVTPESIYENYYDKARFELTWRINLFMTVILPLLAIALAWLNQSVVIPTLIGAATTFSFLLIMRFTRKYELVAFIFCFFGTFLCLSTLIAIPQEHHIVDTMWIMIVILYAFFTLGRKWGIIVTALNVGGIIYFVLYVMNESTSLVGEQSQGKLIGLSVNFVICTTFIVYLIHQFLKTNEFAEKSYVSLNDQLQQKNVEVEHQNEEKTVMLREIHHRVKNNLQVITSLLRLQSHEIKDKKIVAHFEDSIQRILSMALIHEKMYQSDDLVRIDLKAYVIDLAEDLISSYSIEKPIELKVESSLDFLQPKSLVSTAILFNELISNSLKHGFSDMDSGTITIDIRTTQNNSKIECDYHDNGSWKPPAKEGSFGIQLISDLVDQLDGTFTKNTEDGTLYKFVFDYESLD